MCSSVLRKPLVRNSSFSRSTSHICQHVHGTVTGAQSQERYTSAAAPSDAASSSVVSPAPPIASLFPEVSAAPAAAQPVAVVHVAAPVHHAAKEQGADSPRAGADSPRAAAVELDGTTPAYLAYMQAVKRAWPDLPDITLEYRDIAYV